MILTDDLNTCFIGNRRSTCGFSSIKEISMARRHTKTMTTRIFENILFFLEEVFGDKDAAEIPDVPILELAKSFERLNQEVWVPQKDARKLGPVGMKTTEITESPK